MNLSDARVVLRERSLLECFDLVFPFMRLLGARLYTTFTLALASLGVCVAAYLRYWRDWEWKPIWIVAIVLASLSQGFFTVLAAHLLLNRTTSLRKIGKAARPRLWAYFAAYLLSRCLIWLSVFLPPLALMLWAKYAFVPEVALLEGQKTWLSLQRASRLVRLDIGRALVVVLLMVGTTAVTIVSAELFGFGIVNFLLGFGSPFGSLAEGGSLYAILGLCVSVPITTTARFLSYIDLRTRRDGWDIQVRFHALKAASENKLSGGAHASA